MSNPWAERHQNVVHKSNLTFVQEDASPFKNQTWPKQAGRTDKGQRKPPYKQNRRDNK